MPPYSDEHRWDAPPRPADLKQEREELALLRVAPSTLGCPICGAVVAEVLADRHFAWHDAIMPTRPARRVVHGTSTPADEASPYRLFSLVSTQPASHALEELRGWVASQGADLSVRSAGGFRATIYATPRDAFRLTGSSIGFAAEVVPDGSGSRVTVLQVPNLFGSPLIAGARDRERERDTRYDARFDQVEAGVRDLLERR